MKVEKLMTRDVCSCHAEDSMQRAGQIFWEQDCGCVPVTDQGAQVVGMLTDRDVCVAAYTQGRPLHAIPVASAMSTHVHTCRPSDTVAAAEKTMRTNRVRRLPVVDADQRLVGLLSLSDIAREAARARGSKQRDVTDIEVAETLSTVCAPRTAAVV